MLLETTDNQEIHFYQPIFSIRKVKGKNVFGEELNHLEAIFVGTQGVTLLKNNKQNTTTLLDNNYTI